MPTISLATIVRILQERSALLYAWDPHAMSNVKSDIPRVFLPNAGLMEPELGDGQACHMTFEIIPSFSINVVATDPLEASNIQFLTH